MVQLYISRSKEAYALLAQVLAEQYGLAALPELARTATGKPYFPAWPALHFNLSHSGDLALCGVGDEPLGVDVEWIKPRKGGLPRYALERGEYELFTVLGGRWGDFYTLWTRREAWCKYTGEGVARAQGRAIPPGLTVRSWDGEDWRASACAEGAIGDISWR